MNAVTISTKYQIVIPKKIRQTFNIRPGQKMQLIEYGNQIIMIPVRSIEEAHRSLLGIDGEEYCGKKR